MTFLKKTTCIAGVLFLLLLPALSAQKTKDFLFESLPAGTGVSHSTITSILQDRQGFLWMGSWSGLMRYDGYNIQWYYQSSDKQTGLESSKITALFEDHMGVLWVGTRNAGLYCYDRAADRFVPAPQALGSSNQLSSPDVTSITGDYDGGIWIGTENGLNYYDPAQKKFRFFFSSAQNTSSITNNFVYSLAQTPDGAIWVGTIMGLNRIAPNWKKQEQPTVNRYILGNPDAAFAEKERWNFVYTLVPSRHRPNCVWAGTKSGLHLLRFNEQNPLIPEITSYRHDAGPFKGSLSNDYVRAITESDAPEKGTVWVGTFDGLNCIDINTGQSRHFYSATQTAFALNNSNVHALCTDHSGILWIGTEKGINKLNFNAGIFGLHSLYTSGGSGSNIVYTLAMGTGSQRIWAGTPGGGLFGIPVHQGAAQWNQMTQYILQPPHGGHLGNFISAVDTDGKGNLWIATQGAGVLKISEKNMVAGSRNIVKKMEQFSEGNSPESVSDDYAMSIYAQSGSGVWIGLWDAGLNYYDDQEDRIYQFTESSDHRADFKLIPLVVIRETADPEGGKFLWVGTRGNGLFQLKFTPATHQINLVKHYQYQSGGLPSISSNFITSAFTDSKGQFWVTTENGLNRYDPARKAFEQFSHTPDLPTPILQATLEDKKGRLWISTQNGVASILPTGKNFQTTVYDNRDGLTDQFFNSDAIVCTPDGQFLLGGVNGITSFHPDAISTDSTPPLVALTGLRLFNRPVQVNVPTEEGFLLKKSLSEIEYLTLSHSENMVSFEFSALHFAHPEKNTFAYKLEGFNKDWIYTDAGERVANYTNLPHGRYVFLVKAANSDGIWSETPARLVVVVRPPWWLSWWAYILYAAIFAGILYGVRRVTLIRANLRNEINIERLEKQKLEEVNQMKLLFFTNISHELKTPLTLIISPLEELIKNREGDKMLQNTWTRMHRNAVRLLTMINQLLDVRKAEAGLMRLEAGEGNIVQFMGEVVMSFRELARQKHIQLIFTPEKALIKLWFDPDQLEKVFYNILSNAFKFTPEHGTIRVELLENEPMGYLAIRVTDTGKGIPSDKIDYIFDRFYQAEEHHEQGAQGGTGIGLSLAKSVVEQHHGLISAESTPGAGSVFTVSLPFGDAHFAPDEKKRSFASNESFAEYSAYTEVLPVPAEAETGAFLPEKTDADALKPLLLLVEDNPDIRSYLKESLSINYQIEEADNGNAGLGKALLNCPDLVICDISMPGMDGIELCRQLKTRMETSHIPVILLTARTSLIFKIDGLETGADDYITKPFNLELLRLRIHNLIDSRRKLREKFGRQLHITAPNEVALPSLDEAFLCKVNEILDNNLEESEFSVDELAQKLLMSRMQVYRKLKALTDQTPNEFIRSLRLKRAAELLKTGQFTVAEVTYKVGFQDLKYFRERFKEAFGVNPSEY